MRSSTCTFSVPGIEYMSNTDEQMLAQLRPFQSSFKRYLSISTWIKVFTDISKERGWNAVIGSLPFIAILIGVGFGGIVNMWGQKFYVKRLVGNDNKPIPEARLLPMMIGSFFFAGGFFIMGWTSDRSIPWIGYGFLIVFCKKRNLGLMEL